MNESNVVLILTVALVCVLSTLIVASYYLKKIHKKDVEHYKAHLKEELLLVALDLDRRDLGSLITYYRHQFSTTKLALEFALEELGMSEEDFELWDKVIDDNLIRHRWTSPGLGEDFADIINHIRDKIYYLKNNESIEGSLRKFEDSIVGNEQENYQKVALIESSSKKKEELFKEVDDAFSSHESVVLYGEASLRPLVGEYRDANKKDIYFIDRTSVDRISLEEWMKLNFGTSKARMNYGLLLKKAIEIAEKRDEVSPALFQRMLSIDYSTAREITGDLEKRKIVGVADGARPRKVKK